MKARSQSLDVLRGIAVLMVIGRHVGYYSIWHKIGWAGVDLFFVLSGFLVSGLLFAEYKRANDIDFWRFIIRRGLKIWPAFYAFLGIVGVFMSHYASGSWKALVTTAIFLQSYLKSLDASVMPTGHTWSLAVEEHFYLVLPVTMLVLIKQRRIDPFKNIPIIGAVVAISSLLLRFMNHGEPWATHLRLDELVAGVVLGYFFHFERSIFDRLTGNYALIVCAVCIAPTFFYEHASRAMQTWGLSLLEIGFSFLVAWAVVREPSKNVRFFVAPVAAVGFYSYSIYLWQEPISLALRGRITSPGGFWLYVIGCIATGIVMATCIELPTLALRDRLFPGLTRTEKRRAEAVVTA